MWDFEQAKDKVLMGAERKSMLLSDEEKKVTAYHEAGHALVAAMREHSDPLHKVTIIPRGMALGVTMQLPIDDKHTYTRDYLETRLAIMMGGRIAEELFLNTMTTGAGNDIEQASDLARKMVCEFGMSSLGPITFGKKEEQIFLGREISQHRDFSEETAQKIDAEVRRFVDDGYNSARHILESNRAGVGEDCHGAAGARGDRCQRYSVAHRRQGTAGRGQSEFAASGEGRRAAGAEAGSRPAECGSRRAPGAGVKSCQPSALSLRPIQMGGPKGPPKVFGVSSLVEKSGEEDAADERGLQHNVKKLPNYIEVNLHFHRIVMTPGSPRLAR